MNMSKKKINIGDTVLFYHFDFDYKVKGTVKECTPNGIIHVVFVHPSHGCQLWGVHTSALEVINNES